MFSSFLSFFIFSIFFFTYVRSERNLFLDALEEVRTDVDELIAPADREKFYSDYYDVTDILKGLNIGQLLGDIESGKHDNKTCQVCNQILGLGKLLLQNADLVRLLAQSVCKTANYYSERVCIGTLDRMADPLVYLLQNTKLTIPEVCGTLLHPDCFAFYEQPISAKVDWELLLPERKPFKPLTGNLKQLKMLHLSDVHLDLWYTTGSNSRCDEPVCCRSTSYGTNHSAGYWSETFLSCDTPSVFAEEAIEHISETHKDIDFVIWTGDNVPHDVWNTTIETNLLHIKTVTDFVDKSFNNKQVFPCLGNHESHPINMYVPNEVSVRSGGNVSNNWLYDTLADDYWAKWINTESAKKTFKKGGFYSALVNPGLKVIVMNDNVCNLGNFWMAFDNNDIDGQLQWIVDELDEAETNGRYVILIGHVPPSDCFYAWSKNYFKVLERYQEVIAGSYFGHTHKDEIIIFYGKNATNQTYPITHGYIASSITTYPSLNPGYKIFTLDANGKPLDYEAYYTNVTQDNIEGSKVLPKWQLAYSAKQSYGLDSLSTESWDKFMDRAKTDDKLTELYFQHYHRYSEAFVDDMRRSNSFNIENQRNTLQNRRKFSPELLKNTFN